MESKIVNLDNIIEYRCHKAILTFLRNYSIEYKEAESIFIETIKWLWIGHVRYMDNSTSKPKFLAAYPPIYVLDEMWHCFILCTKEYTDFCKTYLGTYIHHDPNVGEIEKANEDHFPNMVSYVIEKLGRETATLWFGIYPIKYTDEWLRINKK